MIENWAIVLMHQIVFQGMFAAYTVLLQNAILLGLSVSGFFFIHKMVLKEEAYLYSMHGDVYKRYKDKVPRYIIV